MNDAIDNLEYDTLTACALRGQGYFAWNRVPIGDAQTAKDGFEIARPLEEFRREALAQAKKRDDTMLVDPHVSTGAFSGAGPRNPYSAPSRVVPHTEGEHLNEELRPRTDKGPLAGLSVNRDDQLIDAALALF